jgi:hypothetical protein
MNDKIKWRRSTYSGAQNNCVELPNTLDSVRDSKNPGPVLAGSVVALVRAIQAGQFRR